MNNKVDKEIEIQFLLAQQIVELKSELKEERKMCNFYIEYSKKLEAKLKEAEGKNKSFKGKHAELILARIDLGLANAKLEAVKYSLMSDEEIENCLTSSEFSQAVKEGIKTQRERTKKAIKWKI